jgi:flagellar hook-length control protein FliK
MLQLAMLLPGGSGLGLKTGAGEMPSADSLQAFLHNGEGLGEGMSAELHAWLMQLSPPMLQRLEQLLAGGSPLPQAAKNVLNEFAALDDVESFAQVFRKLGEGANANDAALSSMLAKKGAALARDGSQVVSPTLPQLPMAEVAAAQQSAIATVLTQAAASLPAGANPTALPQQLATPLLAMGIPQPVGGRDWPDAVGQRLLWMVQGDQQVARLKLNPPNLGPLEVRVSVQQDLANVSFIAQNAAAREALEAALPRLREMFDQNALQLVRADVSDSGAGQERRADGNAADRAVPWLSDGGDGDLADGEASLAASQVSQRSGLIDLFA